MGVTCPLDALCCQSFCMCILPSILFGARMSRCSMLDSSHSGQVSEVARHCLYFLGALPALQVWACRPSQ